MKMEGNGGNNAGGSEENPIRTMKGLLKFCMDATKSEDSANTSAYQEMSQERKDWLEEALKSMSVNTAEKMTECIKQIENATLDTEEGTEQIVDALTELQDWVEDLDIAQDFITIKGLRIIPGLFSSQVSEIRWRSLELLANLCQNNPAVQSTVVKSEFLPPILFLIDNDPNPTVRVKALYALSCLARSNIPVQGELISKDGLPVLIRALASEEEKLRIKASFMIMAMSRDNPALKDVLLDKGLVEQMIIRLKGEHCPSHEHLMAAFVSLADQHQRFRAFCLQEQFEFKSFLCKRIKDLAGKEEFQDEKSFAEEFLTALNSTATQPSMPTSSALSLMPA